MSLLQKYKKVVIPALFKRESGVLLEETISPIEHFGDDREFCKRLTVVPFKLQEASYLLRFNIDWIAGKIEDKVMGCDKLSMLLFLINV